MLLNKKISFLGMAVVLCVLFLVVASYIPTNTIFFTLFSTCFVMLAVYEYGFSGGIMTYFAVVVLSFFLVPDKQIWFIFTAFFGFYPVIKLLIERLNRLVLEWIIKLAVGVSAFFVLTKLFFIFFTEFETALNIYILMIPACIVYVIYDIALSLFLQFYLKKLRPNIKGGSK